MPPLPNERLYFITKAKGAGDDNLGVKDGNPSFAGSAFRLVVPWKKNGSPTADAEKVQESPYTPKSKI